MLGEGIGLSNEVVFPCSVCPKAPKCKFVPSLLSMLLRSRLCCERTVNSSKTAAGLSLIIKVRMKAFTLLTFIKSRWKPNRFSAIIPLKDRWNFWRFTLQVWFPINFEFSTLTSPLVTIWANEQRFSSKQDAQSLKVFSGLRRFRVVTDSNVQGTCFSCSIGIGNASNTTPETQQTDPTILPRTDDGTTSP